MLRSVVASSIAALIVFGAFPLVAGAVTTVTSGTSVTDTYSYTGSTETLTVPANVTQLTLTVTGAEGGQGGRDASGTAPPGGYQGVVTGTISVTPGEVLTIGVGQGGADSPDWNSCSTGASQPTGDPNDAVGGTNPLGGYDGGAGGAPGPSGCSGYGGSGGAASVVELGTSGAPSSAGTIVGGGSGGSGGSGQFPPTLGQISLPTFTARPDETTTTGQDGESVYTACTQVTGEQCDGGGGAGGGGGAQGGSAGFVEFGSGLSDEWFGLGGYPGENSSGGFSGLSSTYNYYSDVNNDGSVVISYSTGAPSAPTNVNGTPGDTNVALYWSAPASSGDTSINDYVVQYATSPFSSWTTAAMCTSASTSCTVTGLTNGTAYEFEVAAVNGAGPGVFSAASGALTPSGPPGEPTITSVTPSDGSLSVAFSAASSSLPLLDYKYSLDGGATWVSGGVTSSPLVINGLTNGTLYSVELRGVNAAGDGDVSLAATGTPSALPGAPTITTITPGTDGTSLDVAFLSGYTGGSSIIGYQYATSIGAGTNAFGAWTDAVGTTSPITIAGLSNGTTYSVELRAVNANGDGPGSVYVVGVTLTVPDTPVITSLNPGNSSIQVSYTPYTSSNDGGSAISGIDYSLDGGSTWLTAGTLSDPFTIAALTNGTDYNVVLRADNGVGSSTTSASASATPLTVPGVPTQVLVTGSDASAQISWSAPASDGGSPVLSYTASAFTAISGGSAVSTCTSTTMNCVVGGLTNDTTYYFDVSATNSAGAGLSSSPRVSALPVAMPGAPTISALTAGNSYLSVPFSSGTQDTNNPITSYQYSTDGGLTWLSATGTTTPITISGLANGTVYSVELRALSAGGAGADSNSEPGTPYAAPDATANATTSYVAESGQVTVSWLAPDDNGAAIASYTVTAFTASVGGSQASSCTTATLSCTLGGLADGTTYYISIQSVNIYSQYSLRSSPLIPVVSGSASSISLDAIPTSSSFGTSVTLSATLTSGATGTVNFESGGVTIDACGAVTIASSSAQCATSDLPVGTDTLQAFYSGDSTYASSVSASSSFVVSAANQNSITITSVSATFSPSPGNSATLNTSGGTTGGAVSYNVSNVANAAGCSVVGALLSYTTVGTCTITATMAGNANYNSVTSANTTFTVRARVVGTLPSAPRDVSGAVATTGVVVSWSVPISAGGSPILDYVVRATPGGAECTSTTTSCTLTGLSAGTSYTLSVVATNETGSSPPGEATFLDPANSTVTTPTVPTAPRRVKVSTRGDGVRVTWSAPTSDGGSTIIGYKVTVSPGGAECTSAVTSCVISGLKAGSKYTFSAVARNAVGPSAPGTFTSKLVSVTPSRERVSVTANFAFGSFVLTARDRRELTKLTTRIVGEKIHSLTLFGYTDDRGSVRFNRVLSRQRADAAGQFLLAQVRRLGYHTLTLHEVGRGILTSGSNRSLDRKVTITD
jgi:titin